MKIEPYLFFDGNCEKALEFYKKALGAEVAFMMRYRESPEPPPPGTVPADYGDKIMHANLRIGDASILASDACGVHKAFQGFSLTAEVPDETRARKCFGALAEGGEVGMPLGKTFFSPCFGMVTDRFGIGWMVIVPSQEAPRQ